MSPRTAIKDTPQRLKQEGHFVGPQISGSKQEGHAASTGASEAEGVYALGETSTHSRTILPGLWERALFFFPGMLRLTTQTELSVTTYLSTRKGV
jgi:hypothetical protein